MAKRTADTRRIKWHPGFWGGIELELSSYRDVLIFEPEHQLSKEPLRMDMLIIRKDPAAVIEDDIGRIFRGYNVVEFKSPEDALTQDDFYKVLGYAFLYKGLGARTDQIPLRELTVSIFRDRFPRKLIGDLKAQGAAIRQEYPGIYYVSGIVRIPVQLVITGRLSREHPALRMLSKRAEKEDLRGFIQRTAKWETPGDRNNISAVLQVAGAANRELFNVLRKEQDMPEVFKEIFKEDLEAAEARGIAVGEARGIALGEARGEARGETRGALKQSIRIYKNCLARGMSEEDARALSELPEDVDINSL